jgi:hypothetical protein
VGGHTGYLALDAARDSGRAVTAASVRPELVSFLPGSTLLAEELVYGSGTCRPAPVEHEPLVMAVFVTRWSAKDAPKLESEAMLRLRTNAMTIGQPSRRSGVSIKVLSEYERLGFLYTLGRSESNCRLFGEETL